VTNLKTGTAKVLVRGGDYGFVWNRLDGIRWTPWNALLVTEETPAAQNPLPAVLYHRTSTTVGGLVDAS